MIEYKIINSYEDMTESDIEAIISLWNKHGWDERVKPDKDYIKEYAKHFLDSGATTHLFVSARDSETGKTLGLIVAIVAPFPIERRWSCSTVAIYVDDAYKKRAPLSRIILNMLEALEDWATKLGAKEIVVGITTSSRLSSILERKNYSKKEITYIKKLEES